MKSEHIPQYLKPAIEIKLADPKYTPIRAYASDAGADLLAAENAEINPGSMKMIDTGVAVAVPTGYVGLVFSRSGQGKLRVSLANSVGVIDSQYRGNIKVIVVNEGDDQYIVQDGITKIAQLVITPILLPIFLPYSGKDPWDNTNRGNKGFGSTG